MPNRYVVIASDFLIGPRMRAAPRRAKTAWLSLAADVTVVAAGDGPPRIQGCASWPRSSWRGFGLSRRDVDAAVDAGLLRWEAGDLVVLGMAPRADALDHGDGPVIGPNGPVVPCPGGLSEAARAQRSAAAKARWTGRQPAGTDAVGHAEEHAERCGPHDAEDAARICGTDAEPMRAASGSASPSPTPPSQEGQDKTGHRRDLRAPASASADAEPHAESDAEPDAGRIDSASGSASTSACSASDPVAVTAPAQTGTGPPASGPPDDPWQAERGQPWVRILIAAGCKVGPKNWPAWKTILDRTPPEKVARIAQGIDACHRWPDQVEEALRSNGGRRTAEEAFNAKAKRFRP